MAKEAKLDIVPSVSVLDGEVVVVRGGRYERLEDEDGKPLEPGVFVEQVLKQYKRVLLIDLNGIENNRPQVNLIQELAELGEVWVDPGLRFAEGIIDILVAGAAAIVLGTKTIAGVDQLAAAVEMSEEVYLGIDYDSAVVSGSEQLKHMSPRSLADIAHNLGMTRLFFTDLSRQAGNPLREKVIGELAQGPVPLYVGGAVVQADLETLQRLGAAGALLSVLSIVTEAT